LHALGLRRDPAAFVARFAALGFPDYQVLAADQGISYEAVCSRLHRARKSLEARTPGSSSPWSCACSALPAIPVALFSTPNEVFGVQTRR
jgi:hypothetical protein